MTQSNTEKKQIVVTQKTMEALGNSILKWARVVAFDADGMSGRDCALCQLHHHRFAYSSTRMDEESSCAKCPIALDTGHKNCGGSPYVTYAAEWRFDIRGRRSDKARQAALDMLVYLAELKHRCVIEGDEHEAT